MKFILQIFWNTNNGSNAGTTNIIYDKNGNLIYSQDANQEDENIDKFTYRNYDGLNRLTGIGEALFPYDNPFDGIQYAPSSDEHYLTVNVYDTISHALISNFFNGVSGYTDSINYTKGNLAATAFRTRYTDPWNFKYYRYDVRGRVIKMWNIISGFDTLETDYIYNSQDQVTNYSHTGLTDEKTYRNTYDYAGRLQKVEYYIGPPTTPSPDYINLAEYEYNPNSQVSKQQFNDKNIENVYSYNNRNWISSMTSSQTIFDYTNSYFLNGNVKSTELIGDYHKNFASSSSLTFNYAYDRSNRLKDATTTGKIFYLENTYDRDGNILTLERNGSSGSKTDDFNYVYYSGTNKLQRVTGSGTQYTYDANGNMISDALNKNTNIKYDNKNLILELKHTKYILNDSLIILTKYYYDESGNRIRKMSYDTRNDSLVNDVIYSRDVIGRELAIYENGSIDQWNIYGMDNIGFINGNEDIRYYMKDHLGSVRAVIDGSGSVISSQDYDAWGYLLENRVYESDESIYKFTSKERDEENQYDYFGARYYDARVGRWGQVEPLIDKYVSISGYAFAFLNPIKFNDFTGNGPKVSIGGGEIDFIFDIYYTTKEYDEVLGLDNSDEYNQVAILERLFEKAPEFMNGSFLLMNTLIDVQVLTNLHQKNSPEDDIIDDLENLAGGYIIAEQAISDQANLLSQERGIGLEGNFLLVAPGKNLRPYNSSGAHELGHDLGLTHKDFTTSTYMNGEKSVKVNSIMGNVTEIKDPKTQKVVKELRTGFSAFEYNKVLRAFKIDNNRNYSTYLK